MTAKQPHERLMAARIKAGYQSASEAARAFGWNENTYRSHENGERGLKAAVAAKYARAFGVAYAYIMVDEKYDVGFQGNTIAISGHVYDGGVVKLISEKIKSSETELWAQMQFSLSDEFMALEVISDNIFGFLGDGDLILLKRGERRFEKGVKYLYVLQHADEFLLRFVKMDDFGKFSVKITSISRPDVEVEPNVLWPVYAIVSRGQWGRLKRSDIAANDVPDEDD